MKEIKINNKIYKIKFGYKALAKSNTLVDVQNISEKLDSEDTTLAEIADIFNIEARLMLAGLQKYHKEYAVDYDSETEVKNMLDKVYDLLDEYEDDNEENSAMELFGILTDELMSSGFFTKLSKESVETLTTADATVVPQDKKRKSK